MIQHVQVDHNTHDAVTAAAREAGMTYDAKLSLIVADWARAWHGRRQARTEFVTALEDAYGFIPGGD